MGNMLNRWTKAKDDFETRTGLKKPKGKKSILGISIQSSGIEKSLGDLEDLMDEEINGKVLKKIEPAFTKFKKNAKDYMKVLTDAIDASDVDEEKATYNKQSRILKAELDYYVNHFEVQLVLKTSIVEGWDTYVRIAGNLENGLKVAHRRCIAAIAEIKGDPTFETWNRVMSNSNPPARSLTTAVKGFKDILDNADRIRGFVTGRTATEELQRKLNIAGALIGDYNDVVKENDLPYGIKDYATDAEAKFNFSDDDLQNNQTEKEFIIAELRKFAVRIKNIHDRFIDPFDKYEDTLGNV